MVRLSDFVWDSLHPPSTVEQPIQAQIPKLNIPNKAGNNLNIMGSNNMVSRIQGKLYAIPTDTDKHYTDLLDLYTLRNKGTPLTFICDKFNPFGEDGDDFTEYANTTAMDADWTTSGPTRDVEASIIKVGNNSMKFTNPGTGLRKFIMVLPSSMNLNLQQNSSFCMWIRPGSIGADDDIDVRLSTDNYSNYYEQKIDISAKATAANEWIEIILPTGSDAPTKTAWGYDGWHAVNSPDWENINRIRIKWLSASATGTWYFDGICITHAMKMTNFKHSNPPGRPNQINYNMLLEQYRDKNG